MRFRFRLIPEEHRFFEVFEEMGNKVNEGAQALVAIFRDYTDMERGVGRIFDIEHEGDEITHEVIHRLNTTFITPFDRMDIHKLVSALDDVLDHIEAAAEFLQLHNIERPLPQALELAETLAQSAQVTADALPNLRHLKELPAYWIEINRLENEGDRLFRRTVAELFSGDYPALEVLKWTDIVEEVEEGIDGLEDVANIIEGIALKQG